MCVGSLDHLVTGSGDHTYYIHVKVHVCNLKLFTFRQPLRSCVQCLLSGRWNSWTRA